MKRLLVLMIALLLVMMTAGSAGAHSSVGFRLFIGLPLFFGYSYPTGYYRYPKEPLMNAAQTLFEWSIAQHPDNGGFSRLKDGPRVLIIGKAPEIRHPR